LDDNVVIISRGGFFDTLGRYGTLGGQWNDIHSALCFSHDFLGFHLFRKRFKAIQNIAGRGSFRAGVLAEGLVKVNDGPAIIWMLLSMNQALIAERLYTALQHDGLAPGKKRPWSTS
jgi:hypothetical protein